MLPPSPAAAIWPRGSIHPAVHIRSFTVTTVQWTAS